MAIASTFIFLVGTILLFWALLGVFSPRFFGLRNMWRVAGLAGFAFVLMLAGVSLDPATDTSTRAFVAPMVSWTAICIVFALARRWIFRAR
jgi:hypothetical protein